MSDLSVIELAASALPNYLTETARRDIAERVVSAIATEFEKDVRAKVAAEAEAR